MKQIVKKKIVLGDAVAILWSILYWKNCKNVIVPFWSFPKEIIWKIKQEINLYTFGNGMEIKTPCFFKHFCKITWFQEMNSQ